MCSISVAECLTSDPELPGSNSTKINNYIRVPPPPKKTTKTNPIFYQKMFFLGDLQKDVFYKDGQIAWLLSEIIDFTFHIPLHKQLTNNQIVFAKVKVVLTQKVQKYESSEHNEVMADMLQNRSTSLTV